jgi:hypothetical protein
LYFTGGSDTIQIKARTPANAGKNLPGVPASKSLEIEFSASQLIN